MEEKKFDLNSAIGFVLLGAIMLWYLYSNQPTPEELQEKEAKQEQVEEITKSTPASSISEPVLNNFGTDSLALSKAQSVLGVFGYGATLPSAEVGTTTLENDLVRIEVANLGGQITEVELKNYKTFDQKPLYIIKDGNADLNLQFSTIDNRNLETKNLFFEPSLTKSGDNQILSMKLKVAANKFLEYRYTLKPNDYMLDFSIQSSGMDGAIDAGGADRERLGA